MYDITIVGAGISGIFLAYTLMQTEKKLNILLIEKGREFIKRICPIENGLSKICVDCKTCNRIQGFGGMGRSEGKFNYTNYFGDNLDKKIGCEKAKNIMEEVDKILCNFGADKVPLYNTESKYLNKVAKEYNCKMLAAKVRHLGKKKSYQIIKEMYIYLKDKIDIRFETDITYITKTNNIFNLTTKSNVFKSNVVVLATGISGGDTFLNYINFFDIKPSRARLDLGIRVEMDENQLNYILKDLFEIKIQYISDGLEATTYCMNPRGRVVKKYQDGLVMADGQNYLELNNPSNNLNFTIFVSKYFPSSNNAKEYARSIIGYINQGKERIGIQRLEDLIKNRPTTKQQLYINSIKPTLQGEGTNLYNEIPTLYINALLKTLDSIEGIIGKKINKDTLLYGIDAKFYEPEINTSIYFETKEKGLYVIGDCSGTTYSLSQATASAVYLGKHLLKK